MQKVHLHQCILLKESPNPVLDVIAYKFINSINTSLKLYLMYCVNERSGMVKPTTIFLLLYRVLKYICGAFPFRLGTA